MIDRSAFFDELSKLASATVTRADAERNLTKLKSLDKGAPTRGELVRGAGVGALAGPVIAAASKTIAGGWKKGLSSNLKDVAGQAVTGAAYGGALPFTRHNVEHEVAKRRLRAYVKKSRGGELEQKVKRTLRKTSSVMGTLKRIAMSDVPGTKPWLLGNAGKVRRHTAITGKAAIPRVGKPVKTKRLSSGTYDVSAMARQMGI